jgi:lactate dehydrogenase-like 2-hydroxyacid dehydrogenase
LKIGVIGLGEIGGKVASIGKAFGASVCYFSTTGKNNNQDYERIELNELLLSCDIISIHAPLNSQTEKLITLKELNIIKKGSILLNLGRGGIICERDLCEFLGTHPDKIRVGLDVLEQEPINKNHKLLEVIDNENILLTPHIGWASIQARNSLVQGIVNNIVNFLK